MKILLFFLSAILAAYLPADDFFNNPEAMKTMRQRSVEFFRRDAAKEAELQNLNSEWNIEKVWPKEGVQTIYTSIMDENGHVFFVTADNFDYQVCRLSDDGEVEIRWTFPRLREGRSVDCFKMKMERDTLLITDGCFVWISQPERKLLWRIANFPFIIKDLWLQDDRVILLGEKQLMSCDRLGEKREMHFAANQMDKILPLFQTAPQAKFLAGGKGQNSDELILFYGERPSAIGMYSLNKKEFTPLATLPRVGEQGCFFNVTQRNGLYLYCCAEASRCLWQAQIAYSVAENRLILLGCSGEDILKSFWQEMPAEKGIRWLPEHCITGKMESNGHLLLYSGGSVPGLRETTPGCSGIVDMKRYPSGASLKFPAVNGLYFHSDSKSIWALEFNEITRLTPKD